MKIPRIDRIDAGVDEHEFGIAMVEAARALFALGSRRMTPERRADVRAALAAGVPLEVRVQLKPTPVLRVVLERDDGDDELFQWVPTPVAPPPDQHPTMQ